MRNVYSGRRGDRALWGEHATAAGSLHSNRTALDHGAIAGADRGISRGRTCSGTCRPATICSGMASSQDASQTTLANAQHGANCCGFCSVGYGGAVVVDPPPLIVVVLQRQYRLSHGCYGGSYAAGRAGSHAQARATSAFPDDSCHLLTRLVRPAAVPVRSNEQAGPRAGAVDHPWFRLASPTGRAQLAAGIGRLYRFPDAQAQSERTTFRR